MGDGCSSLEEAAEEIEKERVVFELDKEKLRICEQKIQHLNEARIAEELDRAIVQWVSLSPQSGPHVNVFICKAVS